MALLLPSAPWNRQDEALTVTDMTPRNSRLKESLDWLRSRRPGIKSRLLLLGVLPAALIALLLSGYFVRTRMADLDQSLRDRGDAIVRQVATAASYGISLGRPDLLDDIATAALQEDDVVEVLILDAAQRPLATAGQPKDTNPPDKVHIPLRLTFTLPIIASPKSADREKPAGLMTLPEQGHQLGSVSLSMSHDYTLRAQQDTLSYILKITVGGLLLAGIFSSRMAATISRPILSLTQTVRRLSQGQFGVRAQFKAGAELGDLRAGFNDMAAELERNRDTLEQRVDEATRQLQQTLADLEQRNSELETARRQAEAQTELKTQFLAQMSHEIRTPMNGIIGFAELMGQSALSDTQRQQLNLIVRSAQGLLNIINEVLDLSKLEAGRVALNSREMSLRDCLEDTVSLVAPGASRVPIVLWISPQVPNRLVLDPVRLQQIITNLLTNALKFTKKGRIVMRVRRIDDPGAARLLFSVSDSGSGIPEQDLGNLFFPFLQLSPYAVNHERGTGLGLTIARNIVNGMGGLIGVGSREGRGSTFWFTLPLPEYGAVQAPAPADGRLVMLVDFDRLRAQATRYQLEALELEVRPIGSAAAWFDHPGSPMPNVPVIVQAADLERASGHPVSWWLEQVHGRAALPIIILETVNRRQEKHYRERGVICVNPPVRSESLRTALDAITSEPTAPHLRADAADEGMSPSLKDLHFLVADDNEINRMLLRTQLVKLGAEVDEARDGGEALELLEIQPYDMAFLDLQMPVLHGLEVMTAVLDRPGPNRSTPIVAVTAHAQPGQRQAIIDRGFAECLIKPILEQQVSAIVEQLLGLATDSAEPASNVHDVGGHAARLLARAQGDRNTAIAVADKLFTEIPAQLISIQAALAQGTPAEAARIAHMVHGTASFCGLEELRRAAKALETQLLDTETPENCQPCFESFRSEIQQLMRDAPGIRAELVVVNDDPWLKEGKALKPAGPPV